MISLVQKIKNIYHLLHNLVYHILVCFSKIHVTSQSPLELGGDMGGMLNAGFYIFWKIIFQHFKIQFDGHFEFS